MKNVIRSVNTLLQSNIQVSTISKETGISKAHITNLKNGTKSISNASFDTVEKLYLYYLDKKDYLEASKNIDQSIIDTKIPRDIQHFISNLKQSIDNINNPDSSAGIEKIMIERLFTMSKEKSSNNIISYLLVKELIPLKIKNEVISYELAFSSPIKPKEYLAEKIEGFTITFAQNDLELMLKRLIHKGAKVKLIKSNFNYSDSYNTGIYIDTHQDEIFKYESSFLDITINQNLTEGE
ncbi:hypothetical protein APV47_12785 [Staphylococcus aureus]|uniref:Uncharacterized protein n=1 Tax=Staphylococcus epidermidis TaxID=1282 RepID=A0A0D4ZZ12_STAEP|nr:MULTISPECIES: hypothetical protein [Staphylococcus]MDY3360374.1 hypothetical protein [Clostridium celatum]AJW29183.1 hypothetical protein [Staphylococcus epidermidis]ARA73654.1 hypothetical protein [Staphylococcus epidermidis]KZG49427.1 hypothetical protein A4U44_00430 [Staphylococcus epidermidis]KZG55038.1 hypothetical protein A0W31_03825 [Staphylococcus epidermidis]